MRPGRPGSDSARRLRIGSSSSSDQTGKECGPRLSEAVGRAAVARLHAGRRLDRGHAVSEGVAGDRHHGAEPRWRRPGEPHDRVAAPAGPAGADPLRVLLGPRGQGVQRRDPGPLRFGLPRERVPARAGGFHDQRCEAVGQGHLGPPAAVLLEQFRPAHDEARGHGPIRPRRPETRAAGSALAGDLQHLHRRVRRRSSQGGAPCAPPRSDPRPPGGRPRPRAAAPPRARAGPTHPASSLPGPRRGRSAPRHRRSSAASGGRTPGAPR